MRRRKVDINSFNFLVCFFNLSAVMQASLSVYCYPNECLQSMHKKIVSFFLLLLLLLLYVRLLITSLSNYLSSVLACTSFYVFTNHKIIILINSLSLKDLSKY